MLLIGLSGAHGMRKRESIIEAITREQRHICMRSIPYTDFMPRKAPLSNTSKNNYRSQ